MEEISINSDDLAELKKIADSLEDPPPVPILVEQKKVVQEAEKTNKNKIRPMPVTKSVHHIEQDEDLLAYICEFCNSGFKVKWALINHQSKCLLLKIKQSQ